MATILGTELIQGGVATVFVKDMDRAVTFYTEALGLRLAFRAGDHWASIDAGKGFQIGLHPAGEKSPPAGMAGGVQIGLNISGRMEDAIRDLESRGLSFPAGIKDDGGGIRLAFFTDPDGNELYICEQTRH